MCNVKCSVSSVQCTIFSVYCAVCSVQCTECMSAEISARNGGVALGGISAGILEQEANRKWRLY